MQQGTYLKVPETGDRGTVFCPAITENFQTLDVHDHNGVNSKKIDSKAIAKQSITLASAEWTLDANGDYKQNVTLPSGYEYDTSILKFIVASGSDLGQEINPTVTKTAVNKFDVFVYKNNFDLKVVIN